MVRARTVAIVAADLVAVVHMELAAIVAASQQSREQQLAFTGCSGASELLMLVVLLAIISKLRSNSSQLM